MKKTMLVQLEAYAYSDVQYLLRGRDILGAQHHICQGDVAAMWHTFEGMRDQRHPRFRWCGKEENLSLPEKP